jgi:SAM-dependent methyltransferase
MNVLDLGCGQHKLPGALGVDFCADSDADVIHNLNQFPYPFPNDRFDAIHCDSILEHLDDIVQVMTEIHRIAKPGAHIEIIAPYFTSVDAYTDPTHKRFFAMRSFDYFTGDFPEYGFYTPCRFRRINVELSFWDLPRLGGLRIQHLVGAHWLARWFPSIYERFFAYLLPARSIRYELEVIKSDSSSQISSQG